MTDAFENQARAVAHASKPVDLGSTDGIKAVAIGLRETWTMAVKAERDAISAEARRYASHYPQSSDGRNTFVMLAEWIENRRPA